MVGVKRVISAADGTPYNEINSFISESHIVVFSQYEGKDVFIIFPLDVSEFEFSLIQVPDTLDELDRKLYDLVEEHIEKVSTSNKLEISIYEDY